MCVLTNAPGITCFSLTSAMLFTSTESVPILNYGTLIWISLMYFTVNHHEKFVVTQTDKKLWPGILAASLQVLNTTLWSYYIGKVIVHSGGDLNDLAPLKLGGMSKKGRCTRHRGARAWVTNLSSRLPLRTVAAYSYHQLVRSSLTLSHALTFLLLFVHYETLVLVLFRDSW